MIRFFFWISLIQSTFWFVHWSVTVHKQTNLVHCFFTQDLRIQKLFQNVIHSSSQSEVFFFFSWSELLFSEFLRWFDVIEYHFYSHWSVIVHKETHFFELEMGFRITWFDNYVNCGCTKVFWTSLTTNFPNVPKYNVVHPKMYIQTYIVFLES